MRLIAIGLLAAVSLAALPENLHAALPGTKYKSRRQPFKATTSSAARQNAIDSIPWEKLDAESQAKVKSVLSDVSIFRRLPIRVVDCDPNMYLFLIRHPDVVVNIWEVLKISSLKLRQAEAGTYRVAESTGTSATVQFLYQSPDTHIIYGEGSYDGPLLARPVKGRCLIVLKSGYVCETNGRHYVTTRLDTFVSVENEGVELLAKAIHPLMGKTADNNFVQSVAFLGSLSRTAEVNLRGVMRLATRLSHVTPENRRSLAKLAADVAQKSTAQSQSKSAQSKSTPAAQVASRTDRAAATRKP